MKNFRKLSPFVSNPEKINLLPNHKVVTTTLQPDGTKTINGKVVGRWK